MRFIRMLPPTGPFATMNANGRQYSAAPGSYLDVPEHDAGVLNANGWTWVALVGTTAQRPTARDPESFGLNVKGLEFIDTTVGAVIRMDSAGVWRNVLTGATA